MQNPSASAPPEYGTPISLGVAKQVMEAAEAEAKAHRWPMVIAIVDTTAELVMLHRMENAQLGSVAIARLKAETALKFKRPTKLFEEALTAGGNGLRVLAMPGLVPLEGGIPLFQDGKVVGAIGVSGMLATQDAQVGDAGARILR